MSLVLTRRMFLAFLAAAVVAVPVTRAHAKDGGSDGDGSDNSGHGSGDDGGGDDGGDDDGGGHDDDSGRNRKRDDDDWSQDTALREREKGRVIPLQAALRIVGAKVRGRVIDVDLGMHGGRPQYRVKVRRTDGVIQTLRLDARTGRIIGSKGL